jgi:Putative bacterial sensory transduction regulator
MAIDAVDGYLAGVGARCLADGEWGLTVPDEHPLDIGIRVEGGLLRVQAFALPATDAPASDDVLHWNRASRIVRFARTRDGDVWVQADLPLGLVDEGEIDRLLGMVVEAARSARAAAYDDARADRGWLGSR